MNYIFFLLISQKKFFYIEKFFYYLYYIIGDKKMDETNDKKVKKSRKTDSTEKTKKKSTTKKTKTNSTESKKKTSTTRKSTASTKTNSKKTTTNKKTKATQDSEPIIQNDKLSELEAKLKKLNLIEKKEDVFEEDSDISELENIIQSSKTTSIKQKESKNPKDDKTKQVSSKKTSTNKSTTQKIEQHKTKKSSNLIYNIIIGICIILIIYSSTNIILWQKNNIDNDKLIDQVTKETKVSKVEDIMINSDITIQKKSYDLSELIKQNSDTVGWISVPSTEINYPVVKGEDNDFYLTHAFDKSSNAAGWIYADYRNKCDNSDKNLIIYGHNRLNNNMFGTLENVLTDDWLSDENNLYINYSNINNTSHVYKVFSTFICDSDESTDYLKTDFSSPADFKEYISKLQSNSSYNFNTFVSESDSIITLYTCHGLNNERLLVCGKLVI